MKKRSRRLIAMLLAASMILQQSSLGAMASETELATEAATEVAVESETAAPEGTEQATEPVTEAKGTETSAPETTEIVTEAATQAETETTAATETETTAPESTEAPAETETTAETETPAVTEAAGETDAAPVETEATEAATEAATEPATEVAEIESETEAPKTSFIYHDDRVTITAIADKEANLPQDAELHADYMEPGTPEYEEAAAALEAAYAGEDVVLDYVFYDIYFTAKSAGDNRIEPEAGKVSVTMQFAQPVLETEENVEVQAYEVVHVDDGVAQTVANDVQTTEDGSVASVGFTSDSFSPFGIMLIGEMEEKEPEIGVPMVIDGEAQDITGLLTDAEFVGAPMLDGKYFLEPNKDYTLKLYFAESREHQFSEDGIFEYQIPSGIPVQTYTDKPLTAKIRDANGNEYEITGKYSVDGNGKVRVVLDKGANFEMYQAATDVHLSLEFGFNFSEKKSDQSFRFNDTVEKTVTFEEKNGVSVDKKSEYDPATGKITYTITVTSVGNNINVVVEDTMDGTALKFKDPKTVKITKDGTEITNLEPEFTEKGFKVKFDTMGDGDVYVLTYEAEVDFTKVNSSFTWDYNVTGNKVVTTVDNEKKGEDTDTLENVTHYRVIKDDGIVYGELDENENRTVTWHLHINQDKIEEIKDNMKVSDKLDTDGLYYSGTGLTVTVTEANGTTTTFLIPWSDVGVTDTKTKRSWTIENLKSILTSKGITDAKVAIDIEYNTKINVSSVVGNIDVTNSAEFDGTSDSGSASVPGVGQVDSLEKLVSDQSAAESKIDWTVKFKVSGKVSPCILEDKLPTKQISVNAGTPESYQEDLFDALDEESVKVTGLCANEWYTLTPIKEEMSRNKGGTWETFSAITGYKFEFYHVASGDPKSATEAQRLPGLCEDKGSREITITYTTLTNSDWLKYEESSTHTNTVKLGGKTKSATVTITKQSVDKIPITSSWGANNVNIGNANVSVNWYIQNNAPDAEEEREDGTYPLFYFGLYLLGVNSDTITITDTFDKGLKYYEGYQPVFLAGKDHNLYASNATSAYIEKTFSPNGDVIFTISDIPKQPDGTYYPEYGLIYCMTPADHDALEALAAGGTYTNTATFGNSDDLEVSWDYDALKKSTYTTENADKNVLSFKIEYNKDKFDLLKGSTELTFTDTFEQGLRLLPDTLSVKADGEDIAYNYDYQNNVLTITISDGDEKYIEITYEARVLGDVSSQENVHYINTVQVSGTTYEDKVESYHQMWSDGSMGGTVTQITLFKYKKGFMGTGLPGAVYNLYIQKQNSEEFEIITDKNNNGKPLQFETDETGKFTIHSADIQAAGGGGFYKDTWYQLVEIVAPEGYTVDPTPIKFYLDSKGSAGKDIYLGGDTIYVSNEKEDFHIVKKDATDDTLLSGAEFSLYLDKNCTGEAVATQTTDEMGRASFKGLQAKTYYLKETNPPEGYELPDPNPVYEIEIGADASVRSKTDGFEIKYESNTYVGTLTNSKEQKGSLTIDKSFVNLSADQLAKLTNFTITVTDESGAVKATLKLSDKGAAVKDGAYQWVVKNLDPGTYTVTETGYAVDGNEVVISGAIVAVDGNSAATTVDITDENKNGTVELTNTYVADVSATISGEKELVGKDLAEGNFTFELLDSTGKSFTPAKKTSNDENGDFSFVVGPYSLSDLTKNEDGTYENATFTYQVREVIPTGTEIDEKIGYDDSVFTVNVTVSYNAETGKLTATPAVAGATLVKFINTYGPSTSVTFEGTKILDGRTLTKADEFTFTVREKATGKVVATGKSDESGKITFSPIKYALDVIMKNPDGTYKTSEKITYVVEEDAVKVPGVTRDPASKEITVTLTYDESTGAFDAEGPNDIASALTFTNTYKESGTAELKVQKVFSGKSEVIPEDGFQFVLEAKDGAPMPKNVTGSSTTVTVSKAELVAAGANAVEKSFGEITYTENKTYEYTIHEVINGTDEDGIKDHILYDTTVYAVTVAVTSKGAGEKTINVSYQPVDAGNSTVEVASFTNSEVGTQEEKKIGSLQLKAHKTMNPTSESAAGYKFQLKKGDTLVEEKTSSADGEVNFKAIEFTLKEYEALNGKPIVYTVSEVDDHKTGVAYDTAVYTVTVTFEEKEEDGILTITPKAAIQKGTEDYTKEVMEFTNTYTKPVSITLGAKKVFDRTLKGDEFSFLLQELDAQGKVKEGGISLTAKNDENGNVAFDEITYTEPNKYYYQITEVVPTEGRDATIVYDETVEKVTVTVEEKDGALTASADVQAEDVVFTNKTTTVKVDKVDDAGRKLADAKLQITLKNAGNGDVVDSWTTDGNVHDITGKLEVGKTYVLEETEVPTGYAISKPIEFTLDAEGNLVSGGQKLAGNLLTMTDAKLKFNVNKTEFGTGNEVEGAELEVLDKDNNVVESWTSKKGETHDFGGKLKAGETYTLREKVAPDGYAYVTDITFTVETDGTIKTDMPKTTDTKTGETTYLVEDAKIRLNVDKRATGTGDEVEGAVLELLDKDGKVVENWTSKKGETHDFGGKLKAGETYTLRETVTPDGYLVAADITFTVGKDGSVQTTAKTSKDAAGNTVYLMEDDLKPETANGSIAVTKSMIDPDGNALGADNVTFFVALFADAAKTKRVSGVKAITFNGTTATTATFDKLAKGTYYVGETDVDGKPLDMNIGQMRGETFEAVFPDGDSVVLESDSFAGQLHFNNQFYGIPVGFYYDGELWITKKVMLGSEPMESTDTFYAGVFEDEACTKLYALVELEMNGTDTSEPQIVRIPKIGEKPTDGKTFYVRETDETGTPLDEEAIEFQVNVDRTEVTVTGADPIQKVTITNTFEEEEETESESETEEEETETETEKAAPRTGDDTNSWMYLFLMAMSAGVLLIAAGQKRREEKETGRTR